ncbi:hypothetical protein DDZ13_13385 [Coraliomargarita sinensis]|uniref:DUF3445 domain-containing protein n=1 Tax=Coraliomargarita sinensis TaxID=2174842 RepID=A0A317ZDP5_9BACT|nr:heme-dependent oxidative N-demethylase subunit alpha family protein [Coraliomargarita sinensis]PXA03210.1 hypothetical protein DDZ13_13385 [Coraliomargarita sinensis]
MPKPWQRTFNNKGFDWSFRIRTGQARDFFSPTPEGPRILEHKRNVLKSDSSRYLAECEDAKPLVRRLYEQAVSWGILSRKDAHPHDLRSLSLQLEPDILLVDGSSLAFLAGSVCMPSSWSLNRTLGKPVHEVHAAVPKLNEKIGQHIDRFLRSIPSGKSFYRENWSITLTDELDYHPDLKRPRPNQDTAVEDLYLRLEHQLFTSVNYGIIMAIRIETVPFESIRKHPQTWNNLAETIRSMPDDVADYKGMLHYRDSLAEQMQAAS